MLETRSCHYQLLCFDRLAGFFDPTPNQLGRAAESCEYKAGHDGHRLGQLGPLSEWGIHAIVKKYAYQARQEDVSSHTLRHSFAKNLVDAGTPRDQVAVLQCHESLDTTRIYTQPSEQDLERAVRRAAGEIVNH